jgi:Meiosis protein SPO22/ZIP4 like
VVKQAADDYQSWQQERLDLAEHFFSRIDASQLRNDVEAAEGIIDLSLEMGKSLSDKGCTDMAAVWLERAYSLLQGHSLENFSPDAEELRLNVLHTYGPSPAGEHVVLADLISQAKSAFSTS